MIPQNCFEQIWESLKEMMGENEIIFYHLFDIILAYR